MSIDFIKFLLFNNLLCILLTYLRFSILLPFILSHSTTASFCLPFASLGKCVGPYNQKCSGVKKTRIHILFCGMVFSYPPPDLYFWMSCAGKTLYLREKVVVSILSCIYIYDNSCHLSLEVFSLRFAMIAGGFFSFSFFKYCEVLEILFYWLCCVIVI